MHTATDRRYLAQCQGKKPFTDRDVAFRTARRKGRHAYRCKFCGNWHVGNGGHKKKRPHVELEE